jgi:hypothetical protein
VHCGTQLTGLSVTVITPGCENRRRWISGKGVLAAGA